MSANPGIVRGENVKPGVEDEGLLLFQQATTDTRNIILKYLRIYKSDPELYREITDYVLGDEIEKAKEILRNTDI